MSVTLTTTDVHNLVMLELRMKLMLECAIRNCHNGLMCPKCRKDFTDYAAAYLQIITEE